MVTLTTAITLSRQNNADSPVLVLVVVLVLESKNLFFGACYNEPAFQLSQNKKQLK